MVKKDDFLKSLTTLSKEDMAKLIKQKGKEPKKIKPYLLLQNNKTETTK